jgi:hypothetical protein
MKYRNYPCVTNIGYEFEFEFCYIKMLTDCTLLCFENFFSIMHKRALTALDRFFNQKNPIQIYLIIYNLLPAL